MNIFLATNNPHKAEEIAAFLKTKGARSSVRVTSAKTFGGMPKVAETENTFEGNARLKAMALVSKIKAIDWVLADDSGLEVDALDGAPGVFSARYAGVNASDEENNAKLLKALDGKLIESERVARFRCCLLLMNSRGEEYIFHGVCEGRIPLKCLGESGFGYDPLFIPRGYECSFAQLGATIKNEISHRARALEQFKRFVLSREVDSCGGR